MSSRGGKTILITGIALFVLMLTSLVLMSASLQDSSRFSRLYLGLLFLNTLGLLTLIVLISINLKRLIRQMRNRTAGARLTIRMVAMFTVLSVTPVLIVYYFSLDFLIRGIDNWFDLRVEQALDDSLELSRLSLDVRMRELLKKTDRIASEFSTISNATVPFEIDELRVQSGAKELTLMTRQGAIIASSADDPTRLVPDKPSETILLQVQQGNSYTGLDTIRNALHIRVVVNVPGISIQGEEKIIQALYPITERINKLAESVQTSYVKYKELSYLREQLKYSFVIILTLVLLFSMFSAVWAAFYTARRLVKPVRDLAEGTRSVAEGDYGTRLPVPGNDELGFLASSFNEMPNKIAQARDEASRSQFEAETQRSYLEAVLERLSSGVLVLDQDTRLRTSNTSAEQILGIPLKNLMNYTIHEIAHNYKSHNEFIETVERYLESTDRDWREQVNIPLNSGRKTLMCSGTRLPGTHNMQHGSVIVIDDITALIQGQKHAAWSEMARRLAHEIKNPLTPIQLATERLRHKYANGMDRSDMETFDRLTNTIIQQVETMKDMVNSFTEFSQSSTINLQSVDLNTLVKEVLDLYINLNRNASIETRFDDNLPLIRADISRLRQVFNNLLKNAFDACHNCSDFRLEISTQFVNEDREQYIEIRIKDSGSGIPKEIIDHMFDPYVTTKTKGSGLGLAIVKKIVEEHKGLVWLENNSNEPGACAVIRFPAEIMEESRDIQQSEERKAV